MSEKNEGNSNSCGSEQESETISRQNMDLSQQNKFKQCSCPYDSQQESERSREQTNREPYRETGNNSFHYTDSYT